MATTEKATLIENNNSGQGGLYGSTTVPLPGDGSDTLGGSDSNLSVSFHDVSYVVRQGVFKKKDKLILNNLSGVMKPGLNAIMGPTGSGKTSLLDVLADRKAKKGLTGTVLVNGQPQPKYFKCMSGYVVQDDVIMGTLTVRENLYFSAALRLPTSMSWSEKKRRVEKTINELGLTACADTKVGTEFIRGVSGGERKRTNIGMELIIEPQVLFLDEPTTGLDAFTAVAVIQLLRNLSRGNKRVIIMSIHQPRYSIYKQFDTLTLLSLGNMVYHGDTKSVLGYFSELGYECEEHDNPADFLLDVINQCEGQSSATADLLAIESEQSPVDLSDAYNRSNIHNDNQSHCQRVLMGSDVSNGGNNIFSRGSKNKTRAKYATNILWQLIIVMIRSTLNLARNPMTSFVQLFIVTVFALLVGGFYFQLDTESNGYQNRVGVIFFIVMNQIFGNLSAIDLFIRQKHIFIHENASGFYRVSAYFIAKVLCDIIPMRLLPLCIFAPVTYFMIGFQVEVQRFFIYFLILSLVSLAASASAFWVSAGVTVAGLANLLVALTYVIQMLFGGVLLTLDSIPVWIRWLQYTSLFRYSIEALIVNEIKGLSFNETTNGSATEIPGEIYLDRQGYKESWLWYDVIGLGGLCVIFLTLTYITLRAIKKEK